MFPPFSAVEFPTWTRGNNCPIEQNLNSEGDGIATHQKPERIHFEQLSYKERRALLKRMREDEPETTQERRQVRPTTPGERALSSHQDDLIGKLNDYAFTLGIDISRAALRRLVMGQTINIDGERYRAGMEGVLYRVHDKSKNLPSELIARFENALRSKVYI